MTHERASAREVPAYDTTVYAEKRHRSCVAVFVINEGNRLLAQLDRMEPLAASVDILIADGGSTDGATTRDQLEPRHVRALLTKTGPGRLSAQMRMAFDYALDAGYENIISIDGNGKDDPSAVSAFVQMLDDGFDYVQGSRFVTGGRAIRTPWSRLAGIKLIHAPLISLAAGFRYTDTTNGFRGYSRKLLVDPRVAPFRNVFSSYELHYYLAIRAAELGFRVTEIPVTRSYPASEPTPTKIHGLSGYRIVMRDLLRACRHQLDPRAGEGSSHA